MIDNKLNSLRVRSTSTTGREWKQKKYRNNMRNIFIDKIRVT